MLAQLFSLTFVSFCSWTLGLFISSVARWKIAWFYQFLLGFSLCNAIFTLLSLFLPITSKVSLLVIIFFIFLILLYVRDKQLSLHDRLNRKLHQLKKRPFLYSYYIVVGCILFFMSLYSPSLHYDAGLYHIPAIKWTTEYPTVYGLVHINPYIGYNFNILTWFAASSFGDLFGQPVYSINLALMLFFLYWILERITEATRLLNYLLAISFLLVVYVVMYRFLPHISTTSVDIAIFILLTTILICLLDLDRYPDLLYVIPILSVYSVTVKLSAIPILLLSFFVFYRLRTDGNRRKLTYTAFLCGIIGVPWLAKTVILTGWLLFPFPYLDLFSFDWKMPIENVISLKETVKVFAQGGGGKNWLMNWILNQSLSDLILLLIAPLSLLLVLFRSRLGASGQMPKQAAGIMVSVLGVAFMFYFAPGLSYGIAFLVGIIFLSASPLPVRCDILRYGFYLGVGILSITFLESNWFHPWHFVKNLKERAVLPYTIEKEEKSEFSYFLVDNKVKCYYPTKPDQCFDHSLPCMPKPNHTVHLRGESIAQGFLVGAKPE